MGVHLTRSSQRGHARKNDQCHPDYHASRIVRDYFQCCTGKARSLQECLPWNTLIFSTKSTGSTYMRVAIVGAHLKMSLCEGESQHPLLFTALVSSSPVYPPYPRHSLSQSEEGNRIKTFAGLSLDKRRNHIKSPEAELPLNRILKRLFKVIGQNTKTRHSVKGSLILCQKRLTFKDWNIFVVQTLDVSENITKIWVVITLSRYVTCLAAAGSLSAVERKGTLGNLTHSFSGRNRLEY